MGDVARPQAARGHQRGLCTAYLHWEGRRREEGMWHVAVDWTEHIQQKGGGLGVG